MSRRSRPPRNRKASNSEAPRDVAVLGRLAESPELRVSEVVAPSIDLPNDELAELDAGWD
jgi:hypothetical protein